MQQVDDPPSLPVGTEVSAKYKGAFCEAKVSKVVRNIKVKVAYKQGLGTGVVGDEAVKAPPGQLRVGAVVDVRHPERKEIVEGTILKIQDCSQYTVVFDDGDITTLRRTALCLKSGRHFNESETLDQLPLTHPEHFGNPVVGGRRGRRRGHMNDDSSEDEDESDAKEIVNEKEEKVGKVVCVEMESKKKDKEKWFPGLVVAPTAQATVRIRVKDEYLVRSFKDGRYYTVPKKEATEFTREAAAKQDGPAVQAALEFLDSDVLPAHWDRDALFGLSNSSSEDDGEMDSDSSDDEPHEEKDRFVAQLYKYMDDRGTPLNKVPSIQSRDVDLYRLFRAVQKRGGYNRVTTQNQWKSIAMRLGFTPVTVSVSNLVKQAFKKFLQPYGEFHRKLGCSMLMTPRNSNRSKGRSLVRANSVASPKPAETNKEPALVKTAITQATIVASVATPVVVPTVTPAPVASVAIAAPQSANDESENTSESSVDISKNKRKIPVTSGKVKSLVEKYEEKAAKDEGDVPLSKIKAAAVSSRNDDKEKDKEVNVNKDMPTINTQSNRDSSPSGPSTSSINKKEKYQRKQTPQNDEKRGKRKKEENIVEKVDAGDFIIEIGDKLKVYYHEKKVTYEAKVIEIAVQRGTPTYLVHYTGWNNRYDEWVPRERIAENLTKGSKHKGRSSGAGGSSGSGEKHKENPPKPPSAASLAHAAAVAAATAASSATSPSNTASLSTSSGTGGASTSAKTPSTSTKRGRGRSDSLPPRSTTPSSVASNSSRTKSPATSSFKRRPTRTIPNSARRTSANVSDVSIATESDTDSDEPVRRPTRAAKEISYKSGAAAAGKSPTKSKTPVSANNSQTDTDEVDEDDEMKEINAGSTCGPKGRDFDLNQIRSELKGFQRLKSPSPGGGDNALSDTKESTSIKSEHNFDFKGATTSSGTTVKDTQRVDLKDGPIKSSTEVSSETDSFGDDDSQSSDKTTTLENMTKKFQQKINADKQRAMEKQPIGKAVAERAPLSKTRIVEKIIKDSLAEKRQESLKAKPIVKDEFKILKTDTESSTSSTKPYVDPSRKTNLTDVLKDEDKKPITTQITESKVGLISPARFGASSHTNKYTSVIVEKPLSVVKKPEATVVKKAETTKKSTESTLLQSKKFIEPSHKEVIKIEPPAACSPSSSSSSSSSSSTSTSSRSLPDMSKLDISGSSSSSTSSYAAANKESKFAATVSKPISPDIYEFKDPEPFEFEIRKSPMVSSSSSSSLIAAASPMTSTSTVLGSRKQMQKSNVQANADHHPLPQNPMSALVNRKKRGSPMKESVSEKTKQLKIDEKPIPLVADAKLTHHASNISTIVSTSAKAASIQSKAMASSTHLTNTTTTTTTSMLAPPIPSTINVVSAPQKVDAAAAHNPFDALRKSPSFNLNINALNEELAQTVQETTRALTDALQSPPVPPTSEATPTKVEASPQPPAPTLKSVTPAPTIKSPILTTPPKTTAPINKANAGSPFVETRKDLSNVFELSTGEGSSSNSEFKDNKFELENAKILLSASAFDLDPSQYENKPTSIADKVLKAISLKKEEVENKNKEAIKNSESEVGSKQEESNIVKDTAISKQLPATLCGADPLKASLDSTPSTSASVLTEPLMINTEFLASSTGLLSAGKKDTALSGIDKLLPIATLSKRTPLTSPEPKLSILESITVKNTDLNETIQKLECAIQRRTPVASMPVTPTPSSNAAADTFSDDSMDSTDSERRLVIEDVAEESESVQKSPVVQTPSGTMLKIDPGTTKIVTANIVQHVGVAVPIPLKVLTSSKPQSLVSGPISGNIVGKLQANTTVLLTPKVVASVQQIAGSKTVQPQQHTHHTAILQAATSSQIQPMSASNESERIEGIATSVTAASTHGTPIKVLPPKTQPQRAATVVPIVVPDIPVSVVVASSAVPSVVAAAQAAAAALQNPKAANAPKQQQQQQQQQQQSQSSSVKSSTSTSVVTATSTTTSFAANSASLKTFENAAAVRNLGAGKAVGTVLNMAQATSVFIQPPIGTTSSGFYLNARTDLRPEDGVKPITDHVQRQNPDFEKVRGDNTSSDLRLEEVSSVITTAADAHTDAINLLCEETIPGSPAPAFGGKEDPPQRAGTHGHENDNKVDYIAGAGGGSKEVPMAPCTTNVQPAVLNPTASSSPNDSASQDESSEELKKNMDVENEVSPRKRKRTRKQSEVAAMADQTQQKRRRHLTSTKKNTAGSDSDDNSDTISQRSTTSARQQQQQQLQQQQPTSGIRPCPYNFLVQLDPSLSPDQCIAILLKQIQDLRKTYNMIKGDLASIDRRRKKLRRREREKKQQMQTNQQIKIGS